MFSSSFGRVIACTYHICNSLWSIDPDVLYCLEYIYHLFMLHLFTDTTDDAE